MSEISSFGDLQGCASQHHAETAAAERVYFLMRMVVAGDTKRTLLFNNK